MKVQKNKTLFFFFILYIFDNNFIILLLNLNSKNDIEIKT
jgi:hypothetical protein